MGKTTGKIGSANSESKKADVSYLFTGLGLKEGDIEIAALRPSELKVDLSYQRRPEDRLNTLKQIANDFDQRRLGVLHVRKRPDGSIYLIDGAGRAFVMNKLLGIDDKVVCFNHKHINSVQDESKWFVKLNPPTTKKVNAKQIFKAAVVSGDKRAVEINNAANKAGFAISGVGKHKISIQAAEFVHSLGVMREVGKIKTSAWPRHAAGGPLFYALAAVIYSTPDLDLGRLIKKLSETTPNILEAQAIDRFGQWAHARYGSNKMALYIVILYNQQLGSKKRITPSWHKLNDLCQPGSANYDRWAPLNQ